MVVFMSNRRRNGGGGGQPTTYKHKHNPVTNSPKQHLNPHSNSNTNELVEAIIMNDNTIDKVNGTNNNQHINKDGSITTSSSSSDTSAGSSSSNENRSEIGRLADAFIMYVDVRDRRYKTKIYKDCFIGSEAVDAMIYAGLAQTRADATELGKRLQTDLRLFSHVKNDHEFKDDYLFYRFSHQSNTAMMKVNNNHSFNDGNNFTKRNQFHDLEEKAKTFYQLADVQDRSFRFKKYRLVFVGSEIIDLMVYHGLASTRWDAVQLGRAMAKHLDLFEHVDKKHTFADGYFFFKFTAGALKLIGKMNEKPGVIIVNSGNTHMDVSDHSSSSHDVDTPNDAPGLNLNGFKKKKRAMPSKKRNDFKYPEPLPSLTESSEDSSITASDEEHPKSSVVETPREELVLKKVINGLRYAYPTELLDDWQVVLAELKSDIASIYTGHHKIVESSPLATAQAEPLTNNRTSTSDSVTTINNIKSSTDVIPVSPIKLQKDLAKSFDAFESIIRKNATLSTDMDASVWTEYVVEEEEENNTTPTNGKVLQDDASYMEFSVLEETMEEATVDLSYIEETVVENVQACEQSPKTVMKPPVAVTPEHPLPKDNSFKTILVHTKQTDDDDMTAITLDHYFAGLHKCNNNTPKRASQSGARSSVCSQATGGTTKQHINTILRKNLWSGDEDVVIGALEVLCAEVEPVDGPSVNQHNHRAFIVQCGGVMAVLRTMEAYPHNETIHYFGCTILKHLAITEPDTKVIINDLEGIPAVAQSMQLHPNSVRINEVARSALAAFL